ncbi:capsid maturation protease [Mycobacterium phage mushipu]|nr:capsid maturation protease [Mycobacterium phage mushipu]
MDLITKALATIDQSTEKDYGPNGGFTAVLSTPSMDRDGDSLKRHEWKEPLPDRVPLDVDHGMSVATTVGSFHPYFEGDKLMMDAYFSSLKQAQDVRTLVDEGHISTVSVAFMNDRGAMKDGTPHRELLNAGIVAIPSNRDAVILQSKALDTRAQELAHEKVLEKAAGAGNGDTALLQAIHDAAVHLGAECAACDELHASDVPNPPPAAPGAEPAPKPKPAAEKKPPAKDADEEEIETKSTIEVEVPEGEDLEAFKARLEGLLNPQTPDLPDEAGTPQDSTEESPADEEPAPVDETAAASEEAAEEPEEVVVEEPSLFETHGEMLAFASSFSGL